MTHAIIRKYKTEIARTQTLYFGGRKFLHTKLAKVIDAIWSVMALCGCQRVMTNPAIVGHGCIIAKSSNHPAGNGVSQFCRQYGVPMTKFVDQLLRARQAYARKHRESDLQQILFKSGEQVRGWVSQLIRLSETKFWM